MARNLTTGLQRGLRRSIAGGLGASDLFSVASLDLRFAQQKTLDPRITFTRASSGTYVGSDGLIKTATTNEARFDHNPTTGESLGLLVEEQRTNLLLRSEEFGTGWSLQTLGVTSNSSLSPSGALTADTATATATNGEHWLYQSTTTASGTYTVSVYVKSVTSNFVYLTIAPGSGLYAVVTANLTTASVSKTGTAGGATIISSQVIDVGNNWRRIVLTASIPTANPFIGIGINNSGNPTYGVFGTETWTAAGTESVLLWGAQLEAGSFPTSYIPTTTATVTRSADVASITGANFSSWYNQTEGTVFVNSNIPFVGGSLYPGFCSIDDGSANNAFEYAMWDPNSDVVRNVVYVGGVAQAILGSTAYTANTSAQLAATYKVNDFAMSYKGGTVETDTSGSVPTVFVLRLGVNRGGAYYLNGTIRRLTYWPSRLPNATLQVITR